ncbi:MAG: 3-hydroxyacyl-CoA dehydrogenase NAD-binding domain-containing protein, partial [Promethearchaeota archaeon]
MNLDDIKNVLIIGAGTMGHSIAQVYAQGGFEVSLVDINEKIL